MKRVSPIRVSLPDAVFLGRARYLLDVLGEAQDELIDAVKHSDVEAGKKAARKLASAGWLFRDAADKHEQQTS